MGWMFLHDLDYQLAIGLGACAAVASRWARGWMVAVPVGCVGFVVHAAAVFEVVPVPFRVFFGGGGALLIAMVCAFGFAVRPALPGVRLNARRAMSARLVAAWSAVVLLSLWRLLGDPEFWRYSGCYPVFLWTPESLEALLAALPWTLGLLCVGALGLGWMARGGTGVAAALLGSTTLSVSVACAVAWPLHTESLRRMRPTALTVPTVVGRARASGGCDPDVLISQDGTLRRLAPPSDRAPCVAAHPNARGRSLLQLLPDLARDPDHWSGAVLTLLTARAAQNGAEREWVGPFVRATRRVSIANQLYSTSSLRGWCEMTVQQLLDASAHQLSPSFCEPLPTDTPPRPARAPTEFGLPQSP